MFSYFQRGSLSPVESAGPIKKLQSLFTVMARYLLKFILKTECFFSCFTPGGSSSCCEMIISSNSGHGENMSLNGNIYDQIESKKTVTFLIKIPHLPSTMYRLLSDGFLC